MAARAAVHAFVEGLVQMGVALEAVYAADSVDTPEEECFAVIRWGATTQAFGNQGTDRVYIWVHDKQKDYGRIALVLAIVKAGLPELVHQPGSDDWVLTQADWRGEGPDLMDQGYGTCTRYAEFQVVSRYATP